MWWEEKKGNFLFFMAAVTECSCIESIFSYKDLTEELIYPLVFCLLLMGA